jgi:hypothetical protein
MNDNTGEAMQHEDEKKSALSNDELRDRVRFMDRWLKRFRDADATASCAYIDAAAPAPDDSIYDVGEEGDLFSEEADTPDNIPIGQINYATINNEIKLAAIAIQPPKLNIMANEDPKNGGIPGAAKIVSKYWEKMWEDGDWGREVQAGLQKVGICGLGVLTYYWSERYGPMFENVVSKELLINPNAPNWKRLGYGGRIVRMTMREAAAKYDPNGENMFFSEETLISDAGGSASGDRKTITIKIYWDYYTEAHVYNDRVIHRTPNLYQGITDDVPLIVQSSIIDPRGRLLPLGDNILASGLNQACVDLTTASLNMAKHGGQITLAEEKAFDEGTKRAIQNGQQQQVIFTRTPINPQNMPIARVPAEQPSGTFESAKAELVQALDAVQGIGVGARGTGGIAGETATSALISEGRTGAIPTQARIRQEKWLTRMAEAFIAMVQRFGGPTEEDPGNEHSRALWQAFSAVTEVTVEPGSTSFRNPATSEQSALQLYIGVMQQMPVWEGMAAKGAVNMMPDPIAAFQHLLRAHNIHNPDQFMKGAEPSPPQMLISPVREKMLTAMYKEAPADIQRQIEKELGFQPSQMQAPNAGAEKNEFEKEKAAYELDKQSRQHEHETGQKILDSLLNSRKS